MRLRDCDLAAAMHEPGDRRAEVFARNTSITDTLLEIIRAWLLGFVDPRRETSGVEFDPFR